MSRGKPETGYDFGNKKQYRRTIWNHADECMIKPRSKRRVLIIETSECEEVLFLVSKGYRPENIHAVNRKAAELAWMTRRLRDHHGIVGVHTHAIDVFDLLEKESLIDQLDAINLDLTGPVSRTLMVRLMSLKLHDEMFVSVTVLRGREYPEKGLSVIKSELFGEDPILDPALVKALKTSQEEIIEGLAALHQEIDQMADQDGLPKGDDALRVGYIQAGLLRSGMREVNSRIGRYRSTAGSQTMLWRSSYHMLPCELVVSAEERNRFDRYFSLMGQHKEAAAMLREADAVGGRLMLVGSSYELT